MDGINGDHILLAPAYNITSDVVDDIVERTSRVINDFFADLRTV
jgi:adenosylmethionine-8-amino-7-oxononanoate aminotransferase